MKLLLYIIRYFLKWLMVSLISFPFIRFINLQHLNIKISEMAIPIMYLIIMLLSILIKFGEEKSF